MNLLHALGLWLVGFGICAFVAWWLMGGDQ